MNRFAVAGLLAVTLSACAPWSRVEPDNRGFDKRNDYSLDLPTGWVRRTADVNDVFITRDGPALNYIVVTRQPHDRKLPRTKRETRARMLPFELAELTLAEWRSSNATANLEILANTPATLGGHPAARVHVRYRNERGLPIERVMVAMVDTRGRLSLLYEAPAIVYFERGLPAFEALLASVRLSAPEQ
ncbi:MAG: hypothetical protein AB1593_02845 [Pseudomonadota bacterium]